MQKQKYMEKWGEHQLRQLARSLNMQIKNNFKDPAVQNFEGTVFTMLEDDAENIYNSLPTPKPSRVS